MKNQIIGQAIQWRSGLNIDGIILPFPETMTSHRARIPVSRDDLRSVEISIAMMPIPNRGGKALCKLR